MNEVVLHIDKGTTNALSHTQLGLLTITKICTKCGIEKPLHLFNRKGKDKIKYRAECRDCTILVNRKWKLNNKDKVRGYARKKPPRDPMYSREWHLKTSYGISHKDYTDLLEGQNGGCAICGTKTPSSNRKVFYVDHDHSSGMIRGLLCLSCNRGIGCFKDNPDSLISAGEYLNSSIKVAVSGWT